MKNLCLFFAAIIILSACGPAPTSPAPTPDVHATTAAIADHITKSTLEAQLSATLPPTKPPLPSATPTELPASTSTPEIIIPISSPTIDPLMAMVTPTPWMGTLSPLNSDDIPTGLLRIENHTGVKEIVITLSGVTLKRSQPIYYAYKVTGALVITILHASYTYTIQVPGKRIFTGTFTQASKDKTTIKVYPANVAVIGP